MKGLEYTQPQLADYELIDCGDGAKLERFGDRIVARPEPQAIWQKSLPETEWERLADAVFRRSDGREKQSENGGKNGRGGADERGEWTRKPGTPERWTMGYENGGLKMRIRLALTGFKHVGVFPEQAANWDFIYENVRKIVVGTALKNGGGDAKIATETAYTNVGTGSKISTKIAPKNTPENAADGGPETPPKVLNLFAYTGCATLAARAAGAEVTHVDSVKQTVSWAADNQQLSGLDGTRWMVDDALKFVHREVRRGARYDGIVLDPPAYGRGPDGEKWVLEQNLDEMLAGCAKLLKPSGFFVLNLYSMGLSALLARTAVHRHFWAQGGPFELPNEQFGELFFTDRAGKQLPLGVYYRFSR